jgi:hypothetical protein
LQFFNEPTSDTGPAYLKPTISLTIIINLLISYPLIISAPLRAMERLLVLIANKATVANKNSSKYGSKYDSKYDTKHDPSSPPLLLSAIARTLGVLLTLGIVACFSFKVKALGYMVDLLGSLFSTTLCVPFPFLMYQVAKAAENKRVLEEKEVEKLVNKSPNRSYESVRAEVARRNLSGWVFDFEFFLQLICGVITMLIAIFGVGDTIHRMTTGE